MQTVKPTFFIVIFSLIFSSSIHAIRLNFFKNKEANPKNSVEERFESEQAKRRKHITYWVKRGVKFLVLENVYIDPDIEIGPGTQIGSNVHILSGSKIGKNCEIQNSCTIDNTIIEDNVKINPLCVIRNSHICKNAEIGPFAHIHHETNIGPRTIIGNFVEVKKSQLGEKTKAKHLTYLGDSTIGSQVNIGAGTITCNYNGFTKNKTIIKNKAFIGSNNTIVAPVTIEKNAFTAAGSTITQDVPSNSLAIGRARQVNKQGYAKKLVEKFHSKPCDDNKKIDDK